MLPRTSCCPTTLKVRVSVLLNTCFYGWAVSYSPLMCRPGGDCGFSLWFSGLWKRQDCTQQQFQSLWEVHPGQLPGEWNSAGVRKLSHNQSFCFNSHVVKTPVLILHTFFTSSDWNSSSSLYVADEEMSWYILWRSSDSVCLSILRAYVEKYLLEKSRLVYQEHNERWVRQAEIWETGGFPGFQNSVTWQLAQQADFLPQDLFKKNKRHIKIKLFNLNDPSMSCW